MTTRKEIENLVAGCNKPLGQPYLDKDENEHPPKVTEMPIIELLRNLHPLYRTEYARRLQRENVITEHEAHEFVK